MLVAPLSGYTEKVVVIDYGISNLFSVRNTLRALGCEALVSDKPDEVLQADRVILPGVGAFGVGMQNLRSLGMVDALREVVRSGRPLLGICLGMQLLADESEEHGRHEGLGIIPGRIRRIPDGPGLRIPHIGWNAVACAPGSRLYKGLGANADFYFVHSFYFDAARGGDVAGTVTHGVALTASVEHGMAFGAQYHPEKSHRAGLTVLKNFLTLAPC